MNKKIAALLFAMGVGVSASPVVMASCQGDCYADYRQCKLDGGTEADCRMYQEWCNDACAG